MDWLIEHNKISSSFLYLFLLIFFKIDYASKLDGNIRGLQSLNDFKIHQDSSTKNVTIKTTLMCFRNEVV